MLQVDKELRVEQEQCEPQGEVLRSNKKRKEKEKLSKIYHLHILAWEHPAPLAPEQEDRQ